MTLDLKQVLDQTNPYRGVRPDLSQKLKKLQAQQPATIIEADETKKTFRKDSEAGFDKSKTAERKPPLHVHKRGISQNPTKDLEKTAVNTNV